MSDLVTRVFRRCQVYRCPEAAVVKCSSGFLYCEAHKKPHGSPGNSAKGIPPDWHTFKLIVQVGG